MFACRTPVFRRLVLRRTLTVALSELDNSNPAIYLKGVDMLFVHSLFLLPPSGQKVLLQINKIMLVMRYLKTGLHQDNIG